MELLGRGRHAVDDLMGRNPEPRDLAHHAEQERTRADRRVEHGQLGQPAVQLPCQLPWLALLAQDVSRVLVAQQLS
jgi:hypothetical protein